MTSSITVPLDIPEVEVLSSEITSENHLLIRVESTQKKQQHVVYAELRLRVHLAMVKKLACAISQFFGLETYILIRPKRGQCLSCHCDPTTTQIVSWYEQRSPHTQAYDEYLVMQLINSTIEDVSLKEEVGYDAVVGALNRLIEPKINWDEIDEIGTLGIDEISRSKGRRKKFSAIITARQPKGKVRILGVLP
ncbi:hypothetical protein KFU94_30620 [Chloroflexi bacterium TSY]|nr:hypothetical protein [Chloroflexi bacterium TSY]